MLRVLLWTLEGLLLLMGDLEEDFEVVVAACRCGLVVLGVSGGGMMLLGEMEKSCDKFDSGEFDSCGVSA